MTKLWILLISIHAFFIISSLQVNAIICTWNEGSYTCTIPLRMNVPEKEKPIFSIELQNTSLKGYKNKPINYTLIITNTYNYSIPLLYYGYIYQHTTCISCNQTRNESLKKIEIDSNEEMKIQETFIPKQEGEFNFKIKYKKENLKTWKELKGNVSVKDDEEDIIIQQNFIIEKDSIETRNELKNSNTAPQFKPLQISKEQPKKIYLSGQKSIYQYLFIGISLGALCLCLAIFFFNKEI